MLFGAEEPKDDVFFWLACNRVPIILSFSSVSTHLPDFFFSSSSPAEHNFVMIL
jgi:hypothetical protein